MAAITPLSRVGELWGVIAPIVCVGPHIKEENEMTREEFLKAFDAMSPEDQAAIRAKLLEGAASGKEVPFGSPMAMMQHMMLQMQSGGDPMAICKEMMGRMKAGGDMVKQMMEKMQTGGDPMAMCKEIMGKRKGGCGC